MNFSGYDGGSSDRVRMNRKNIEAAMFKAWNALLTRIQAEHSLDSVIRFNPATP